MARPRSPADCACVGYAADRTHGIGQQTDQHCAGNSVMVPPAVQPEREIVLGVPSLYFTRWKDVRLAFGPPGVPDGATRFQKSVKSFDAVMPSKTESGVPAP